MLSLFLFHQYRFYDPLFLLWSRWCSPILLWWLRIYSILVYSIIVWLLEILVVLRILAHIWHLSRSSGSLGCNSCKWCRTKNFKGLTYMHFPSFIRDLLLKVIWIRHDWLIKVGLLIKFFRILIFVLLFKKWFWNLILNW